MQKQCQKSHKETSCIQTGTSAVQLQHTSRPILAATKNDAQFPLPPSNCTNESATMPRMQPFDHTHSLVSGETAPRPVCRSCTQKIVALRRMNSLTNLDAKCAVQWKHAQTVAFTRNSSGALYKQKPCSRKLVETFLVVHWRMVGWTRVALHQKEGANLFRSPIPQTRATCLTRRTQ